MIDAVYIYTDGACSGNPGPGGWAALLRYKTKEKLISGAEPNTTNNRMELMAAISGLRALSKHSNVILVTDSKYVKDGITVWIKSWRAKGLLDKPNTKIKNVELWQQLDELNKKHNVDWQWVRGHNGHVENEIVDKAAREAITNLKYND
jgi:ribonuclease HI